MEALPFTLPNAVESTLGAVRPANAIRLNAESFKNALAPILATPLGIEMLVRLVQPLNAQSAMLVTLLGIVILVSPVQSPNAPLPMLVTLVGMVKFTRSVHP